MGKSIGNSMAKTLGWWLLVWCCALLGSLIVAETAFAQASMPAETDVPDETAAPAATDNLAISIDIPVEAPIGGAPVEFALSVANTHPSQVVTFTALIVVESGLAGPESWSQEVDLVANSDQGRIYRWTASVAARRTLTLEATSHSGNELGEQPALTVRVLSDQDELLSTRQIEIVPSTMAAQGGMELTDLTGDQCDLEEECLLLLRVASPSLQAFRGGPFVTEACEFLGLDEEFDVDPDRAEEELFWFVTRTSGIYGHGCIISVPITMGSRTFTVTYEEALYTYLPVVEKEAVAGQ